LPNWMGESRRKVTGGLRRPARKKRRSEIGTEKLFTSLGDDRRQQLRTRGGTTKVRVVQSVKANAVDPKTGKVARTTITTVKDNSANRNYVVRNIFNKGAIVMTPLGLAKVTSRPGQDGVVNVILIEG
jgi:small subunit ribosomal protein S8e